MDNQEQVKKLKTAATIFKIFKFVGLAVLIFGGIMISYSSYEYLLVFFTYLQGGASSNAVSSAAATYLVKLFKFLVVLLVGLAALITFNILKNKKLKKLNEIKHAQEIKEAVEVAINKE